MAVVTILGAGVMGSAMSFPAADRGHSVRLVGTPLDDAIIDVVAAGGPHPKLAVELPIASAFRSDALGAALDTDTDLVVLGVSTAGIAWAVDSLVRCVRAPVTVLMITKGLAPRNGSVAVLPDVIHAEVEARTGVSLDVAAIGGPCIAGELAARRHTGVVLASANDSLATDLCQLLETPYYQPRPSADLVGVELCAALKNFYAISVGWALGRLDAEGRAGNGALNHNPAAILFSQAVLEMAELTRHFGGDPASAWGLPGAGDLYVTCQAGRNCRLGRHLGAGATYADVKDGAMRGETIEGAETGIAIAPVIEKRLAAGQLRPAQIPLMRALFRTLIEDRPLDVPWQGLHRAEA